MAVIELAKQIHLNLLRVFYTVLEKCGDYKEIKELDVSGIQDTRRRSTIKQSFKTTSQVMSQS